MINNAFHHGVGHLTLDVRDATTSPIESFFTGVGGADVSNKAWTEIAKISVEAAHSGKPSRPWHLIHDGVELEA